jgi:hypothetical protein
MRNALVLSVMACSALIAGAANAGGPKADPAAQLAKITAGRTAGTPVDCLRLQDIRSSRIVNGTAIVYEGNNGTLYVNMPASGATFLHDDLTLVTDTHSDQLCSIDTVRLMDMTTRMPSGSVGLSRFVPYARPAQVHAG